MTDEPIDPAKQPDPLAPYVQYTQIGDPASPEFTKQWFAAALSEGGHTSSIYGKTKSEVDTRARAILAARGVSVDSK